MSRRFLLRLAAITFLACLVVGSLAAQNSENRSTAQKAEQGNTAAEQAPADADGNAGIGTILGKTTEESADKAEKWGRKLGMGRGISFLISVFLNFACVAAFFYLLLKSRLPRAFRDRTAAIQESIKEARAARADATHRLSQIESRLSKLDYEVAQLRTVAEREAAAEEARIRQAAEEDTQKLVAAAEAEIAALARNARRELKGYAAGLAVDLAARRIRVDEPTDQALVRDFVEQLGKDGK